MLIPTVVSQNMQHVWKHKTKNEQSMLVTLGKWWLLSINLNQC